MKTAVVGGMIVGVHAVVIGSVFLMGGCGKTATVAGPEPQTEINRAVMPPVEPELTPPRLTTQPEDMTGGKVPAPAEQQKYVIKRGDSLSTIAHKYGVNAKELAKINNITNPNKIKIGQTLVLPGDVKMSAVVPKSTPKPVVAGEGMKVYTVQKGDVLSRIAVRHGTTTKALMTKNELSSDKLKVGQKIVVPAKEVVRTEKPKVSKAVKEAPAVAEPAVPAPATGEAAPEAVTPPPAAVEEPGATPAGASAEPVTSSVQPPDPAGQPFTHEVIAGETLQVIADKYNVPVDKLMSANNLTSKDIKPPLTLKIPQVN